MANDALVMTGVEFLLSMVESRWASRNGDGGKLQAKGVHLMVANDVTAEGAGFDVDTNIVTLIERSGRVERLEKMSKDAVAGAIFDRVADLRSTRRPSTVAARQLPRRRS